jgi:sulfopyruvate decarboxylase subunit beta
MVNPRRTDYAGLARAAGIHHARTVETLAQLERDLPAMLAEPGPSFMSLTVEAESGFLGTPPMPYEGPEMKYRFGRALERKLGIKVFGPQGY